MFWREGECPTPTLDVSFKANSPLRYHSNSILDSIHRSAAIEEWHNIQIASETAGGHQTNRLLERALGAFDMFVLHDQPGDLDDVGLL